MCAFVTSVLFFFFFFFSYDPYHYYATAFVGGLLHVCIGRYHIACPLVGIITCGLAGQQAFNTEKQARCPEFFGVRYLCFVLGCAGLVVSVLC